VTRKPPSTKPWSKASGARDGLQKRYSQPRGPSMAYRVEFRPKAEHDLEARYRHLVQEAPLQGPRMLAHRRHIGAFAADRSQFLKIAESDAGRIVRENMPWGNAFATLIRASTSTASRFPQPAARSPGRSPPTEDHGRERHGTCPHEPPYILCGSGLSGSICGTTSGPGSSGFGRGAGEPGSGSGSGGGSLGSENCITILAGPLSFMFDLLAPPSSIIASLIVAAAAVCWRSPRGGCRLEDRLQDLHGWVHLETWRLRGRLPRSTERWGGFGRSTAARGRVRR
jgi:hypothetical protein